MRPRLVASIEGQGQGLDEVICVSISLVQKWFILLRSKTKTPKRSLSRAKSEDDNDAEDEDEPARFEDHSLISAMNLMLLSISSPLMPRRKLKQLKPVPPAVDRKLKPEPKGRSRSQDDDGYEPVGGGRRTTSKSPDKGTSIPMMSFRNS